MNMDIVFILSLVSLIVGLGQVTIDTSWVDEVLASVWEAIWDAFFGSDGVLTAGFNLLPVVGNNSLPVATWFMLAVFGGFILFINVYRRYG